MTVAFREEQRNVMNGMRSMNDMNGMHGDENDPYNNRDHRQLVNKMLFLCLYTYAMNSQILCPGLVGR